MIVGNWSAAPHGTLAQRLAHALRQAIAAGLLSDGVRLPAERHLATALSVSRSTVTSALDELRADGLVASRQGSGTVVSHASPVELGGTRIAEHYDVGHGIDLLTGNPPDPSHLPPITLDIAAMMAMGGGPGISPLGLPVLRRALATRHTQLGRYTEPEQIHVTSGAHQALALLFGALVGRNTPVAVEDPGYAGVFDAVESLHARPVPLRCDRIGVLPDDLDAQLRRHAPPVVYLQSGPHNPTGRVPTEERAAALAAVLDRHDTILLEDRALADLSYGIDRAPEIAVHLKRCPAATMGSFSKVAWAGLRIGWIRAPEPVVERTRVYRLARDLGCSVPSQMIAAQLVPHLDDLAAERRRVLQASTVRADGLLGELLPEWSVVPPSGGSALWALTPLTDTGAFTALADHHGVKVAPGSIARADRRPDPHVRICVDRPWPQVQEGLHRLAAAWRELRRARPRSIG